MEWYRLLIPNRTWIKEIVIAALVLSFYFVINTGSSAQHGAALKHANEVIVAERSMGIFVEVEIQGLVKETVLVPVLTGLYIFVHPLLTVLLIIILFLSGYREYPRIRNTFAAFSLLCFTIFFLYPTAPPRMMAEYGFVDLLHEKAPVSYETAPGLFNPYASMPSVHFGYSLIVGAIIFKLRGRIPSALGITYPFLMFLSVTASANHFILDCLASVLLLGATYYLVTMVDLPDRVIRIFKNMSRRT